MRKNGLIKNQWITIVLLLCFFSCNVNNKAKNGSKKNNSTDQSLLKENANNANHTLQTEEFETNLIIIGGGKKIQDAKKIKEKYFNDKAFNSNIIGTPTILLSDTISGLNPGFFITTIGCVSSDDEARSIAQKANNYWKGV